MAAVRLYRVRDPAVLSVVYRFTMIAVLVTPLVTIAMKQSHVDGWWPIAASQQTVASAPASNSTQLRPPQSDFTNNVDRASQDPRVPGFSNEALSLANITNQQQPDDLPLLSGLAELKPSKAALDSPGVATAAAQPPTASDIPDVKTKSGSEQDEESTPSKTQLADQVPLGVIRGTILGISGPLANAEVYWWRSRVHDDAPIIGRAFHSLVIQPGEDRDLGNITIDHSDE